VQADAVETHRRGKDAVVRVPDARITLSSSAVYPESTATAFELAARLGYDGVELMVTTDPLSQDIDAVRRLSEYHQMPVYSVHAPTLLITQYVWGDAWGKVDKSIEAAKAFGSDVIVVHPPFRWQQTYARDFARGVAQREQDSGIGIAVENMFPWRAGVRELQAYLPGWDPRDFDYAQVTLDLSHTATAGVDAYEMAVDLGPRLTHLHLADGSGSLKDEHLVPGRGNQRCADVLELMARRGYSGSIVLEVNTRRAATRSERETDLAEALAFARLHFAAPVEPAYAVSMDGTIEAVSGLRSLGTGPAE
jgi:sugar phosphate isomerase/epimerase